MAGFETLKGNYKMLCGGCPGRRFRDYTIELRKRRAGRFSVSRIVSFISGLALTLLGVAIGWLPGPGGFLAILGLALLAQEIPWIAAVLDVIELQGRKFVRWSTQVLLKRSK